MSYETVRRSRCSWLSPAVLLSPLRAGERTSPLSGHQWEALSVSPLIVVRLNPAALEVRVLLPSPPSPHTLDPAEASLGRLLFPAPDVAPMAELGWPPDGR